MMVSTNKTSEFLDSEIKTMKKRHANAVAALEEVTAQGEMFGWTARTTEQHKHLSDSVAATSRQLELLNMDLALSEK